MKQTGLGELSAIRGALTFLVYVSMLYFDIEKSVGFLVSDN